MTQEFISTKPIPTNERLIMALDFPSIPDVLSKKITKTKTGK
jgi:hypothetical protein